MNAEPAILLSLAAPMCRDVAACERAISQAADAGFAAVEWSMGQADGLAFDIEESQCIDIGKRADRAGLAISAVRVTEIGPSNLGAADDGLRQQSIDRVIAALDRAAWMGCDTVIVSPGVVGEPPSPVAAYEDVHAQSLASLSALRFEAERRAARIACRSHHARFLLSPLEMRAFIDACNSPWVGACLDLDVIERGGGFPHDWIRSLGHRVMQIRVGDAASSNRDGPRIAAALGEMSYRGPITCLGSPDDLPQAGLRIERLVRPSAS